MRAKDVGVEMAVKRDRSIRNQGPILMPAPQTTRSNNML